MAERLKDMFFTDSSVKMFAKTLKKQYANFDEKKFQKLVFDESFKDKGLMQMMRHTTGCLALLFPKSYQQAVKLLMKAAPEVKGCECLCLPDYVELYGLEHWDLSLRALALFTKYSSSEFAIRPYITKDSKRAMAFMGELAEDPDDRVRRFASEGCRPRLPWATALPAFKKDPRPILPILEKLKDDNSEFVQKSVANNLNDISKDNPKLVLDICERWKGSSKGADWIIKRACRTLLKEGNKRAMQMFGFGDPRSVQVENLKFARKAAVIGEKVPFSFVLRVATKKCCKVRLEYIVYFTKAGGKTSKKVFQLIEKTYDPGSLTINRTHSFIDMSTRKHYPGKQRLAIVVNGVEKAETQLRLRAK